MISIKDTAQSRNTMSFLSIDERRGGAYRGKETSAHIVAMIQARALALSILVLVAFSASAFSPADAVLLPYDYPASGTEILCYINGIQDVHGVPVIRPPTPTFNVGTCGSTPPPPVPAPACSNGADDDGDGFSDRDDPNCHVDGDPSNSTSYVPNKGSEEGTLPACWNKLDDDGDGKTDFAVDAGCSSALDSDEADESAPPVYQCSNGGDDDSDGLADNADPGCHSDFDVGNFSSYTPNGDDESASASPAPAPQCSDGSDNDGDGKVDGQDPGCSGASDNDETDPSAPSSGVGSSSGGGSGGGGGGSSGGVGLPPGTTLYTSTSTGSGILMGQVLGVTTALATTTDSCDRYLTAFIRAGKENDEDQVKRLQRFLMQFEGAALEENGVFDTPTLAAVHGFQTRYAADILTPWGIKESTGYVYLTTRKKVNEIFCGYTKTFFLTMDEQRKIDEARALGAQTEPPISVVSKTRPTTTSSSKIAPKPPGSTATSTSQGQSGLGRALQFLQRILNR